LRSPDTIAASRAPFRPLLVKELRQIAGGRALWTMLLLLCPLVGYSFVQAVSLYGEASRAAMQSPSAAGSLSPLDGVLVPTFGAFYVAITLLFPFVAIRVLGHEKETGALRLLIQLPYRTPTLIAAKLVAILAAWLIGLCRMRTESLAAPSLTPGKRFLGIAAHANRVSGRSFSGSGETVFGRQRQKARNCF
jgi:ABC-2 type transport system permease protein